MELGYVVIGSKSPFEGESLGPYPNIPTKLL